MPREKTKQDKRILAMPALSTENGTAAKEFLKRVERALDRRAEFDYQCFQLLRELFRCFGGKELANYLIDQHEKEDAVEFVAEIDLALKKRLANDEDMLTAVAGRPCPAWAAEILKEELAKEEE